MAIKICEAVENYPSYVQHLASWVQTTFLVTLFPFMNKQYVLVNNYDKAYAEGVGDDVGGNVTGSRFYCGVIVCFLSNG